MSGSSRRRSRERRAACTTWAALLGVSVRNIMRENRRPVRYSRALESLRREARREYAFGEWYWQILQRFAQNILGPGVELVRGKPWIDALRSESPKPKAESRACP